MQTQFGLKTSLLQGGDNMT